MAKFVLKILLFYILIILPVNAENFERIKYKNILDGQKISVQNNIWSTNINRKGENCFIKRIPNGSVAYTEFYNSLNEFIFSTATNYEFLYKGALIGYSNIDLKFYEFYLDNGILNQRELITEEVEELFPNYKIVKLSNFSETNSYKIKKKNKNIKLILLNDTNKTFYNYKFTTNNSDFKLYNLKGFINITKKGLIQFSSSDSMNKDWFVILVR